MVNYLSIDFESWAYPNLSEFEKLNSRQRKELDDGYVKESAKKILVILKKHKTKLTFFILGQLYDWYPEVIEKIAHDGHEIAYHTHTHDILKTKKDLINSLKKSRRFLKRFKPRGFRAPLFSIKKEYFSVLRDYGFKYDSSIYDAYLSRELIDGLLELPVSKLFRLPVGSGICLAAFGKKINYFYRRINQEGSPFVAFIHNWQIIKPKKATFPNGRYLLKRPYYLPYTFEIGGTFENLLQSFSLAPMERLI